jgi:hypothetical protein
MPHVLRLVDRRVGDGDGRAGALALLRAAALAVIPSPQSGSLEVSEQHHVEHPKTGQHSSQEQRNGTGERP